MSYGMIGYVVPHSIYPNGYHCNPKLPLPYINIGSQKNFIVLHHLGIYGSTEILDWFVAEYPKHAKHKLDMGKGCVRFKKVNEILVGATSEIDSISLLTHWVADEMRYSGISMGEGEGFTLHCGEMNFTDRCGVCKDKAGMLITMLRSAGFE